jgi:stress response protein YsnF
LAQNDTAETKKPASGFWAWLFGTGVSDEERERYTQRLRDGSIAVSVVARSDAERERAIEVMEQFDPIDIEGDDGRSVAWETSLPSSVAEHDHVIPLPKEELEIGKRQVERRHRVRTHVVERPAETQVQLRDERMVVERRPARASTAASLESGFKEGDVEVIERHEEPVVAKAVRADEEVVVRTEARDRVVAVKETLRETKVDVDEPARDSSTSTLKDRGDETDAIEVVGAPPKPSSQTRL